jgi:hypothetical protein
LETDEFETASHCKWKHWMRVMKNIVLWITEAKS